MDRESRLRYKVTNSASSFVNHMSTVIPIENERTDPEGRPLVPARPHDTFRHQRVWAVYRFQPACRSADARCSEFVTVAMAKGAADQLNRTRTAGQAHYFRVYRLATSLVNSNSIQAAPDEKRDLREPCQRP